MNANSATDHVDVAIVGGGISGLAAALRVAELAPQVRCRLLERSHRFGGILETVQQDDFLIERSADSFITDPPWALNLCQRLGIEGDLLSTQPTERRAYVVRNGRPVAIPDGFQIMATTKLWPIFKSPLLSFRGKCRLACERFVRPRPADRGDESLAEFATRRLGREAFQRLVQPLVGGIYTADAERLSVAAALPRFVEMEQQFGSITRGLRSKQKLLASNDAGARYSLFMSPRHGVQQLVAAIVDRLPSESLSTQRDVVALSRCQQDGSWQLDFNDAQRLRCKNLILATPAYAVAQLLSAIDQELSEELSAIPYAGCAVVCLGFARSQFPDPPPGFGFVVPAIEKRKILAASFSSMKFRGRAPEDHVLVRVFMGGACQPEVLDLDDARLVETARSELQQILNVSGPPVTDRITRWSNAMPQYHVGHAARIERIEQRVAGLENLALAGNAYHGVGIPQCIRTAEAAAEQIIAGRSE